MTLAVILIYGSGLVVACLIGAQKGRGVEGFLLGLILSWLGVAIILLTNRTPEAEGRRPCPYCAEPVLPAAMVCPHCQRPIAQLASAPVGTERGWHPDPSGRHAERWWTGSAWTKDVREADNDLTRSTDPPVSA